MIFDSFDIVFCDDIRHEASGKLLLVGCYQVDMRFSALPAMTAFSMWIRIHGLHAGHYEVTFRIAIDGEMHHLIKSVIDLPINSDLAQIFATGLPLKVDKPGRLTVEMLSETEEVLGIAGLDLGFQDTSIA